MTTQIQKTAETILNDINDDLSCKDLELDPITMIMIASIMIEVIKLLRECRNDEEEMLYTVKDPTPKELKSMNAVIRNKIGFFRYWLRGHRYRAAFRKAGYNMTLKKITRLNEEVSDDNILARFSQ